MSRVDFIPRKWLAVLRLLIAGSVGFLIGGIILIGNSMPNLSKLAFAASAVSLISTYFIYKRATRSSRWLREGRCPRCGYDAIWGGSTCPECGHRFSKFDLKGYETDPDGWG